ncbi:NAD(P)H-hydrate dehydratase [Sphingobium sp. Sx8-8]|uniref:NAD(P)H-hydrate dehydratase n=1 Tax=Sphingobium sp. Sx8-8 TaxID=2933617 RepID=UPI001F5763EE|nr:NAD(P)H-hydrate dehydratase [Sphingobium sp. Sx8-8]
MRETRLDATWLRDHPLPPMDEGSDKNERGRILAVGGAEFVPGALRLTGEAALRAGAGKLQMATVRSAALPLGVLVPEAAMIALPAQDNGEIAASAADLLIERALHCDGLILGPGMSVSPQTDELVTAVLEGIETPLPIVLDAAALTAARDLQSVIARHQGHVILTPHHGEMAILAGLTRREVAADPKLVSQDIAKRFEAVVMLKGKETILAGPNGDILLYEGGCVGLATGGSGDVLAGVVGGLAARGVVPLAAAAWATWVHGRAGRRLESQTGGIGFLAREILPLIPKILNDPTGKGEF